MCLENLTIKSNIKNYIVHFEKDKNFLENLVKRENTIFIIDKNVYNLHKSNILANIPQDKSIFLDISEEMKNIETACFLYEKTARWAVGLIQIF